MSDKSEFYEIREVYFRNFILKLLLNSWILLVSISIIFLLIFYSYRNLLRYFPYFTLIVIVGLILFVSFILNHNKEKKESQTPEQKYKNFKQIMIGVLMFILCTPFIVFISWFRIGGILTLAIILVFITIYVCTKKWPIFRISKEKIEIHTSFSLKNYPNFPHFEIYWNQFEKIFIKTLKSVDIYAFGKVELNFLLFFTKESKQKKIELNDFQFEKQQEILEVLEIYAAIKKKPFMKIPQVVEIDNIKKTSEYLDFIRNLNTLPKEEIEEFLEKKHQWEEIEIPNIENNLKHNIFGDSEGLKETESITKSREFYHGERFEDIIIEETPKIEGISIIIIGISPFLLFLMLAIMLNSVFLFLIAIINAICSIPFIIIALNCFKTRIFIITNTEIIYEGPKNILFKIKWDEFDSLKVETKYLRMKVGHFRYNFKKKNQLVFIKDLNINRIVIGFTKKNLHEIYNNLEMIIQKIGKEFQIEKGETEISFYEQILEDKEERLKYIQNLNTLAKEEIDEFLVKKHQWEETEILNLKNNSKYNKIGDSEGIKESERITPSREFSHGERVEDIIIEETPRKEGIFTIITAISPLLLFLMLAIIFNSVFLFLLAIFCGVCIYPLSISALPCFKTRKFIITNTEIIYEGPKNILFKIKWDEFDSIKVKTKYFRMPVYRHRYKIKKIQLVFIKDLNINRIVIGFTKKKLHEIYNNLERITQKMNKEFQIEKGETEISFYEQILEDKVERQKYYKYKDNY